jgi:tRNA-2-methylthio-N6-dimethylallyladenosine synthase
VPYTRGHEVSRPLDEVINDVTTLVKRGNKEIWLLGQNVNSYQGIISNGSEKSQEISRLDESMARNDRIKIGFAKLLRAIDGIDGNFKIYFTSNHPKDMSDEIINAIAESDKIAKIIHLPVQSGSDKILKAMNRPYASKDYLSLIKKLRAKVPNVEITTDVIVGFPGETEDDFQKTVNIFKKVKYYQAYINKYSPRPGTAAFKFGDPIPWSEKQRRWRILNDLVYNKQ